MNENIDNEQWTFLYIESNTHNPNKFSFGDSSSTGRILILVVEELFADTLLVIYVAGISLEVPTSDMLVAVKQISPCIILSVFTTAESRHSAFS